MGSIKVVVHSFSMGDVDDPEIYAAQPIWEWQQTPAGRWIMEHSQDTYWTTSLDSHSYSQRYNIVATLTETDATYWALKYDNSRA